jgi:lipoic acid synthetase
VDGHPGVWVGSSNGNGGGKKIASVGVAVRNGTTRHGLSLNVAPDMGHFDLLVSCGNVGQRMTSMERELGWAPDLAQVVERFRKAFGEVFECQLVEGDAATLPEYSSEGTGHPTWLWRSISHREEDTTARMEKLLARVGVHTVCQEAHCPNIAECFGQGTATFMILGDTCSRGCRFCAVSRGKTMPPDPGEPRRVAAAAARLGLQHVVITSVTRDDLEDGGAGQFAATVRATRQRLPEAVIEVLVPDFRGSQRALESVLAAEPEILNHNVETVPRLYPSVRPGAGYRRSLGMLARAKQLAPGTATKSGLMLGLGERTAEVMRALYELRQMHCDLLTLGQYLQPTEGQLPVERFVSPEEFDGYRTKAERLGFRGVAAGPLVRSSHRAGTLWRQALAG